MGCEIECGVGMKSGKLVVVEHRHLNFTVFTLDVYSTAFLLRLLVLKSTVWK